MVTQLMISALVTAVSRSVIALASMPWLHNVAAKVSARRSVRFQIRMREIDGRAAI